MSVGTIIGLWLAAGLTIIIFSFIYKDNPLYKFGEHLFLGVSLGYGWCIYYYNDIFPNAIKPLQEISQDSKNALVLIPIILGLFIILRVVPSLAWLSRFSFALYIGGFAGLAVPNVISGVFLPQLTSTINPLGPDWPSIIKQVVLLVGVFCTVVFFFFSWEHRGAVGKIGRVGILYIMVAFGASFGYTVMARVSLLIGRIQFMLHDWIGSMTGGGG
ncbi:hypothetical protein JW859_13760 [bacterium]|nr:hypothetical protein [bacterium]